MLHGKSYLEWKSKLKIEHWNLFPPLWLESQSLIIGSSWLSQSTTLRANGLKCWRSQRARKSKITVGIPSVSGSIWLSPNGMLLDFFFFFIAATEGWKDLRDCFITFTLLSPIGQETPVFLVPWYIHLTCALGCFHSKCVSYELTCSCYFLSIPNPSRSILFSGAWWTLFLASCLDLSWQWLEWNLTDTLWWQSSHGSWRF